MPVGMPVPPASDVDPFTDPDFAPLDTSDGPKHIAALGRIAEEHPELQTGLIVENQPAPTPLPIPQADEPEVIEVEGGIITISHDTKGWYGVLEQEDGGGKETFHGKTQKELMTNVLQGKLKATAQIRKLNKKLKLGTPVAVPSEPVIQPASYQPKQLTANDIFEIKTELQNDPDKAFESWFQKKFGMSATQLVATAQEANNRSRKGEEAYEELSIESVSKEFLESHPDYYPHVDNGQNIMTWLCRNKLGRQVTKNDNFGTISADLLRKGLYTVENLDEALEELRDSGLLIPPPDPDPVPTPIPVVQPTPVVSVQPPAPTNPRIASERRQPRGGLGIRPSAVSAAPITEERAPSADELENMSSKDISELLAKTRTYALSQKGHIRR